jgi:hypothetical protein
MTLTAPLLPEVDVSPRRALPYSAHSPALAREWVRETLQTEPAGDPPLDPGLISPDVTETVEILTSELVTNAVVHARSMVVVHVAVVAERVQVLVEDTSPAFPTPRGGDVTDVGRGLLLVDELASSWGWGLLDTGKHVWFQLDLAS